MLDKKIGFKLMLFVVLFVVFLGGCSQKQKVYRVGILSGLGLMK